MKIFLILLYSNVLFLLGCNSGTKRKNEQNEQSTQIIKDESQSNNEEQLIQEYLEENNIKAKSTKSGLYYFIEKPGKGKSPQVSSNVTVHYLGKMIDGNVFDSSYERGQTVSFDLNNTIKGWQEGLQLIKEGGKIKLIIPSKLGYGAMGSAPLIPPNAILIFDLELIKVE